MNCKNLISYKLLFALSYIDETYFIMRKDKVMKIDSTIREVNRFYYYFDSHYQIN